MSEPEDEVLLRLAQSVADGEPVDWQEASQSQDTAVARVKRLEILASIARVYGMPPESPPSTGDILFRWGHLEIREKIGEGVFGEVFCGWDGALEREVAVKFLRPGAALTATHVLQEARHLARVRHPGVVTVHGAEEIDGRVGIWMECVHGRTLEDLLQERGPFEPREALQIGIDLCRALGAVHRAGLVHRDVKTRNVVREDSGRIVLMDLGAGVDARAGDDQAFGLAGTPIYLAPEVLRGEPAGPQADLYGLGVLLYRLVTGAYPITGADLNALRNAHARGEGRPLHAVRPDLPKPFVAAIEGALATDPARRFASADAMAAVLVAALDAPRRAAARRVRIAVLAAATFGLAVLALVVSRTRPPGPAVASDRPAIAVADVVTDVEDRDLDALSGMLITSLEQSRSLSVFTRSWMNSVLTRAGKVGNARIDRTLGLELGRQVNAVALLVPSIHRAGTGYRLGLEAVDPRRARTLFGANAEASTKDGIPAAIDALSRQVRARLERDPRAISATARPVAQITTGSLSAYHHYDQAERFIDRLEMPQARAELEAAIAQDSTFGLAHTRLAYVCWWLNDGPGERAELDHAFALVDRVPERERYHLRAQGAMADRQGLEAARAILLEMERFYPHDKEMLYDIGDYSSHLNEFPTAIQYLDQVLALDAGFVRALQHLTRVYRDMGRNDQFLKWAKRYAEADTSWDAQRLLGDALVATGQDSAGAARLMQSRSQAPDHGDEITASLANAYVYRGRAPAWLREYDHMLAAAATPMLRSALLIGRADGHMHQGAYRGALADLAEAGDLAHRSRRPVEEAMAHMEAAVLLRVGRDDARAAAAQIGRCAGLEASITYQDYYFQYWPYWGGRFKLDLMNGDLATAEAIAKQKFTADKWYGPYVASYLHAAKGEGAQAVAAASQVLEWGPASENIPLLYFLARCQAEHGQLDEAAASLVRLQSLHTHLTLGTPYYAKSLMLLGKVHDRRGDARLAAQSYAKLAELWRDGDRDLADHIEVLRRLEALKPALVARR